MAAITCSSGPPCVPGKTCLSTAFASSVLQRIIPPRGPRNVLWVVVVTICAWGTGDGYTPPATSPAKCAMSTTRTASTSSAIDRKAGKSTIRAYALPPPIKIFGFSFLATSRTSS